MKEHLEELKLGGRPMTKLEKANKEIERLHSIIKEVREYGKEVLSWTTNEPITDEIGEHILEIVEKEN